MRSDDGGGGGGVGEARNVRYAAATIRRRNVGGAERRSRRYAAANVFGRRLISDMSRK